MSLNAKKVIINGTITLVVVTATLFALNFRDDMRNEDIALETTNDSQSNHRILALEQKIKELSEQPLSNDAPVVVAPEPNADLLQQLAAVQQQLVEVQSQLAEQSHSEGAIEEIEIVDQNSDQTESMDEIIAKQEAEALQRDAAIEAAFQLEQPDEIWSTGVVTKIEESFNTPALNSGRLINADCRSTTCLIEFALSPEINGGFDPMYENNFIGALRNDLPSGTIKSIPDGSGGLHYTVYMAKSGHSLAGVDIQN